MTEYPEFEIVDRYGARWRYARAEGYFWQWSEDRGTAEVWHRDTEDEIMLVFEFPAPAAAGDVTPNTCLNFNLREGPPVQSCPACGFVGG